MQTPIRARSMQTPIPGGQPDRTLHELRNPDKPRASHTEYQRSCGAAAASLGSAPESGVFAKMIRTLFWLLDELLSLYTGPLSWPRCSACWPLLACWTRETGSSGRSAISFMPDEPALRPIRNFLSPASAISTSARWSCCCCCRQPAWCSPAYMNPLILGTLRPLL